MGRTDAQRVRLVGFVTGERTRPGAHLVAKGGAAGLPQSLGHITSTAYSPALEKYVALGLLEDGPNRIGQRLVATYPLKNIDVEVEVVSSHFFDPAGVRQNACSRLAASGLAIERP